MNQTFSRSANTADATAEMNGSMEKEKMIDSRKLAEGDVLIGLTASGMHPSGTALARKVFDLARRDMKAAIAELGGRSLEQVLLEPARNYDGAMNALLKENVDIHTSGSITNNFYTDVPQMMPDGLTAQIILHRLPHMPILELIQEAGRISDREMYSTFNMGVGMILAVPADQAQQALTILRGTGEGACRIGTVVHGDEGVILV